VADAGGSIHEAAALGFAQAPEAYERGRPSYPPKAVAFLARALRLEPGRAVLDLAAGTGKLTRLLAPTGARLVAVEPVAAMRAKLADSLPAARVLAGRAESIPLEDASLDAVTVAQAFHWFEGDVALAEIHRVLAPGGRLGLVWNVRDERVRWVARLTEIIEPHRGWAPGYRKSAWREAFARAALFSPLVRKEFRLDHHLAPEDVVARVASVSFIAALPGAARAGVLEQVRELLADDPGTRGRSTVVLPYRTEVYWCERR
jgi:SAM-dependent methyltransferase